MFHHVLGMHTVSDSVFFGTIKEMYPHVKDILDGICLEARKEMQDMDQKQLGSWRRAVTCGDAVWLTRGSFSRNCTYTVRNYLTGALLYYYHICQKGSDDLCEDEIYEGTSKAAEGFGANEVFKLMVRHQMNVECHIQDGDSTSGNVVLEHFPLCRVLRCGNHVAKNHAIKLDKLRKLKEMTNDGVEVECCCKGKRHSKHCGCLTEKFINLARLHYHVSTNIGLIQGCMTYLFAKRGPRYHWILDILERMCLPVVQNLPSILQKLNEGRFFDIQSQKTNAAKAKRKLYKRKRKVFEHQRRQLFVKESAMKHDYGGDVSTEEVIADASTDKCKCGSTDHRRISIRVVH